MKSKDKKYIFKKPLFAAGIASLVLVFAGLIANSLFYISSSPVVGVFYSLSVFFASLIFIYGFYVLGNKYDNKLLKVLSVLGIIGVSVFYLSSFGFGDSITSKFTELNQTLAEYNQTLASISANSNLSSSQLDNLTAEVSSKIFEALVPFFLVFAILFVVFVIYSVIYGVALIRLNEKVKYAKIAGILEIVGACTLIIGIGFFILVAAFVFEIMILFDQAKKFKEY